MQNIKNTWFTQHLTWANLAQALRISLGIIASILIAEWLQVDFAPSTGVVALLSIQFTRRETIKTALRRVASFGYTLAIAYFIHEWVGYHVWAFSLVVLLIVILSVMLGWADTLSVNIVIAVHLFMMQEAFTTHLLLNETKRLVIGVGIALLLNLYHANQEPKYRSHIDELEQTLQKALLSLADFFRGNCPLQDTEGPLADLKQHLDACAAEAKVRYNNSLHFHARYYTDYVDMRTQEYVILENTRKHMSRLAQIPKSGIFLAEFITEIAVNVDLQQPLAVWEDFYADTYAKMNEIPLPETREEFQQQSALFSVLDDLSELLQIKRDFIDHLTEKQKKLYWNATS